VLREDRSASCNDPTPRTVFPIEGDRNDEWIWIVEWVCLQVVWEQELPLRGDQSAQGGRVLLRSHLHLRPAVRVWPRLQLPCGEERLRFS